MAQAAAVAVRFGIDDEVHATLAEQRDVLGAVTRHGAKAHALEQGGKFGHIRRGVFDELESVRTDGIVPERHRRLQPFRLRAEYSFK
jgi:hypothetical protein